jgi:hypothetical protein
MKIREAAVRLIGTAGILLAMGAAKGIAAAEEPKEPSGKIQILAKEIVLRPDGSVVSDRGSDCGAGVGADFEFALSSGPGPRGSVRCGPSLAPLDWGTSLLAHTGFKLGRGTFFRFEWRERGKIFKTDEVLSKDFAPVTRTFLVESGTGLKHVIRFTPSVAEENGAVGSVRVDRMKFDPGAIPGPLLRDGKMVALIPGFGPAFERAYVNIPGEGFFQFSLHPFPGSEPTGSLDGAVLSFPWQDRKYSWYLGRDPMPAGAWTVFVKATAEIPPEWQDAIPREYRGSVVAGGSYGSP